MEKIRVVVKKILISLIVALTIGIFSSGWAYGQDPGIPDTVRLEMCPEIHIYGPPFLDTILVQVYAFNDEPLSCMHIPLTWIGPSVAGEGIDTAGTRSNSFTIVNTYMSDSADIIFYGGIILWGFPFFPPGTGKMAQIKLIVQDTGAVIINKTVMQTGEFLSFCDTSYNFIYPQFTPIEFHIHPANDLYGDVNSDELVIVNDVVYLVNYIFRGGPPPEFLPSADVNTDCQITIADVVYLVNYIFKSGPIPKPGGVSLH